MDKKERYTYYIDEYDEFNWGVIDNTTDEDYVYLEDITKVLNEQAQENADLEAKLAESENKFYELQTKLNLKEYAPAFCSLTGGDCETLGKVDQLKQQLTDMTEKYNACQEARKLEIEFNKQDKAQLKQQLAEKDLKIIELETKLNLKDKETNV